MDDVDSVSAAHARTDDPVPCVADPRELAARLRIPLTPVVGLLEVFLRRWGDELTSSQTALLRTVDRDGRRVLARLDELAGAAAPAPVACGVDAGHDAGHAARGATLETQVVETVADLLRAHHAEQMLATLRRLVESSGGTAAADRGDALATMRVLPDELRVPEGREMTLGPVLRALSSAAVERASGELAPTRRAGAGRLTPLERRETLVALELTALGTVRSELGDPGTRWLVDKLCRTLRPLLREHDSALRYPATRFLLVLGGTGPERAQQIARRIAWEWDTYLGRDLRVIPQVEPIEDGDLAAGLRRLSRAPDA